MLVSIGLTIGSYYWIKTNYVGIDRHQIPFPPSDPKSAITWTFVVHVLYFPTLGLIKSSVLIFLLRLGGHTRQLLLALHLLNGVNLAITFAVFVVSVAQCTPVSSFWDPNPSCINQRAFYLIQTGLNILTDAFTLGAPVWMFKYAAKMGRRMKLATLYVFLLGFIVTVVGIIRFVFMYLLLYTSIPYDLQHYTMSFCLSAVETNLAIVCACAPTLRGLVRTWFPRALHTVNECDDTDGPFTEAKSSSAAGTRDGGQPSKPNLGSGDGLGYHKDGRGRVLCSHAAVGGLGLSPSEEDIMRSNGILRTTDVVVEHGDDCSLRSNSTIGSQRDRRGSGGSF